MAEYIKTGKLGSGEFPITPFADAVRQAQAAGLQQGRNFLTVGNWELGIDTTKNVIYHAVFRP